MLSKTLTYREYLGFYNPEAKYSFVNDKIKTK